ncbi:4a-hydroxytetrahydrobiopterin dehydratase [Alcanivorax sp. 1008]|uniref:4a-hydroxytetrahydrobiopterin dehydratase n=1 Tax=Alcanivorax sp. 1008 TaxID=2816853 RepID=UPI001D360063|nr:4a-hydroxytetrahydrobiopterin dehydratase [Alcanivorax sp. 1008]MCC1495749.1 4a-hydroxytetrahydrobiopterin dehydratase [Alcanivorax sp. 1008]
MSLANETCEACRADAPQANEQQIALWHGDIPEWKLVEEDSVVKLQRQFSFTDFAAAMAFTEQVAELAESLGHHPALLTEWGKVTVTWWTHKIGGLHRNDFICAARTDLLTQP